MNGWFQILSLVLTEVVAEICLKKWSMSNNNVYIIIGVVFYGLIAVILGNTLKIYQNLTLVNTLWHVGNIIIIGIANAIIFKSKLSYYQIGGIVLAIISTILMSIK